MSNGSYGTYAAEKKAWRGESKDEFYAYALMDASMFSFTPGASVWMFAKSLKAAMETAADLAVPLKVDTGYCKNWDEARFSEQPDD